MLLFEQRSIHMIIIYSLFAFNIYLFSIWQKYFLSEALINAALILKR